MGLLQNGFSPRLSPWAHNKRAVFPTRSVPTAKAVGSVIQMGRFCNSPRTAIPKVMDFIMD